jgi:parallel beta-helix repeat protein
VIAPGADDQTTVQTALIDAAPGSLICLKEGRYSFTGELSLSSAGVTVRGAGKGKTILDFSGQKTGANGLSITGDGVTIEALEVHDTPGDGVRGNDVEDITLRDLVVGWSAAASPDNGAYGLYPIGSHGVRIERCVVYGARDAGIYVGQSTNALVVDSEAYGNVAGIEIENTTDVEVRDNAVHDNTAGILVFNLPNLPVQDGKRAKVHENRVENNNLTNFALEGDLVSRTPTGVGVMVLASDANEIHDNVITGNRSTGVLIARYHESVSGPYDDPAFDPYPQGNFIHDNELSGNGADPHPLIGEAVPVRPVPDIVWDGCEDPARPPSAELRNCLSDNGAATFINADICDETPEPSQDIGAVTCEHEPLPPQDP